MRIPAETLDAPVGGVNLVPGSLRDQLADGPTLLVFLRFFGCIFCRETVADLREQSEKRQGFPKVVFVSQAARVEIQAFLRRYWPEAATISDPEASIYDAFGVGRSVLRAFAPGVFAARRRAIGKGHQGGAIDGDVLRLPGVFLVAGDRVLWSYDFRHVGEEPDFAVLADRLAAGDVG